MNDNQQNSGQVADKTAPSQVREEQTANSVNELNRRKFLTNMLGLTGGVIALTLGVPLAGFALSPALKKEKVQWLPIGSVSDMKTGEPTKVTYSFEKIDGWVKGSDKRTVWVVKKSDSDIVVFSPNCTHLGCGYNWDPGSKEFKCPCHGAVFTIDGEVKAGPPPRPLDRYETKVAEGKISIGKLLVEEG